MEETFARPSCLLYLPLEICWPSFNLEKAVCNHGFFMMAPNKWIPSTKTLQRPLRLADQSRSVNVSISHPCGDTNLHINVYATQEEALSSADRIAILEQVARMLRISYKDEKAVNEFHKLHPRAKEEGFGRIFRSPSLFEDAVKSILLCNCTWNRTLGMAKSLCELQLKLSVGSQSSISKSNRRELVGQVARNKRKGGQKKKQKKTEEVEEATSVGGMGNFPTSKELANLKEVDLQQDCSLGFRARRIIKLAQGIEKRTVKLEKLERECDLYPYEQVHRQLRGIKGFGPFVAATTLMCMGCYQMVPADTETIRHLKQVHGRSDCNIHTVNKDVEEIYKEYAPFQCIAYWFELLDYYEKMHGKLSELNESDYHRITGSK